MKEELKELGLNSLETISKEVVEDIFKICEIIIKDTETSFDDKLLLPILPKLKEYCNKRIEEMRNNGSNI